MPDHAGQPTKYREELCEEFVKLRASGFSVDKVAATWELDKKTIYNWRRAHPQFFHAFARGDVKYNAFLEDLILENVRNPKFNDRIFRFLLAKAGWSDKSTDQFIPHPGFAENPTETLNKEIEEGQISSAIYDTLQNGVTKVYEREKGDKIIEASEVLKDVNKEKDGKG